MNIIRLRALEPEDLDTLYHIENDRDLWDVGTTNVPYSRYALHNYIATASGDIYTDRQVRLMVVLSPAIDKTSMSNDEAQHHIAIGMADLFNFDPSHRRAEVGIVIMKDQRQKGYALEAIRQLHDYAHHTLHLHQLYAVVAANNRPALCLFRSSGYSESACLSQWLFNGDSYTDAIVMQKILGSSKNC